jgi:hypothetical protein
MELNTLVWTNPVDGPFTSANDLCTSVELTKVVQGETSARLKSIYLVCRQAGVLVVYIGKPSVKTAGFLVKVFKAN